MHTAHKIKAVLVSSLIISYAACMAQKKNDFVIFSGAVTNKTDEPVKLYNMHDQLVSEIKVLPDGIFKKNLKLKEGMYVMAYNKARTNIYLKPQADIKTAFDAENVSESIKFAGEGRHANEYLKDRQRLAGETMGNILDFYKLDAYDFKSRSALIAEKLSELLNSRKNIPASFKEKEEHNIYYENLSRLIGYSPGKNEGVFDVKPYLDKIDLGNVSESDFDFSRSYEILLKQQAARLAQEKAAKDNISPEIAYLKVVSGINVQRIREQFLYDAAKADIKYTAVLDLYYNAYISAASNEENKKAVTKLYTILSSLSAGKMSPVFTDYVNYNGGKSSLSDFKGKYLYIDIWATWCKPCREEIPSLKQLEHAYKGKNIEFISISIDKISDIEKWKNMIREQELGGVQLLADHAWESQFIQDYYTAGIPKFILLDPKGEIVSANAPRPSSKEASELLKSLNL